jgi:hypothetical protein
MCFNLHEVELEGELFYDDDDKRQITSVYLKYNGEAKKEKKLSAVDQYCLDGLVKALETIQKKGGDKTYLGKNEFVVTLEEWRPHAYDFIKSKKKDGDFKLGWQSLVNKGIVMQDAGLFWKI